MSLELVIQLSGCEGLARMAELELDAMEFPSTSGGKKLYGICPSSMMLLYSYDRNRFPARQKTEGIIWAHGLG